jgi:single-strand DNA-binding protein
LKIMAVGETTVTLVGSVASELTRRTSNGHDVVSFWVRSTERRRDRHSGDWIDGRHLSVKVTCWRKLAEAVHCSLTQGDPVIVTGRLYTGGAGEGEQSRPVPELEASAVGPNLNRCTAVVQRVRRPRPIERPEFRAWRPLPGPRPVGVENALVGEGAAVSAA